MWWFCLAVAGPVDDLALELDKSVGCADTSGLGALPGWLELGKPPAMRPHAPPQDLPEPARARAVALLWLAATGELGHLPTLAATIDDDRPAGAFPSVQIGQMSAEHYPVRWSEHTVGQVALAALGQLAGREFADAASWRTWSAAHPDPVSSALLWHGRLSRHVEHASVLGDLDPVLALRVRLLDAPYHHGLDEQALRTAWRAQVSPERTAALLTRAERWEEHADPEAFGAFAAFAFAEAPDDTLDRLWADGLEPRWTRAALAAARYDRHPDPTPLLEVLAEAPTPWMDDVLERLAAHHPTEHTQVLVSWLHRSASADPDNQQAILRGLGRHGAAGRPALRAVLDAGLDDQPHVVSTLVETARAMGLSPSLPRLDDIWPGPLRKHAPPPSDADRQRAADARADCVHRIRAALDAP